MVAVKSDSACRGYGACDLPGYIPMVPIKPSWIRCEVCKRQCSICNILSTPCVPWPTLSQANPLKWVPITLSSGDKSRIGSWVFWLELLCWLAVTIANHFIRHKFPKLSNLDTVCAGFLWNPFIRQPLNIWLLCSQNHTPNACWTKFFLRNSA
jgi:hypothetical protein